MKAINTFTLLVLMAAVAFAQTSTTKKTTTPASKPTTTTKTPAAKTTTPAPAKTAPTTATKTAPTTATKKPAAKASPMTPKTTAKQTKPTEVNPPATKPAEPAKKKEEAAKPGSHRDPFVSPVMARTGGGPIACAGGKKCLVIDQLNLQGVVQTVDGMIAVVANPANRVYYLHESDPLFDGYVVKIMLDQKTQTGAVIFRQNVMDKVGQQTTRDVTKRVEAPAL